MIHNILWLALVSADPGTPAFKVGYVDMQGALSRLEEAKREQAKIKKEFETRQKKLDTMQDELKKLKEDFDKQASMLKEEARTKKQEEMQTKYAELQKTYMTLQQDLQEQQGKASKAIFDKLKTIVEKIGDRDGYSLMLDRSDQQLVLYFKRHTDVTDEVVQSYNALHK